MRARDRLVNCAIDLLRRNGVAGTGIAEIIERGNVSRRSIYLNFPQGKAQLMAEAAHVAGHHIDELIATFAGLPSPRDALAAFVNAWKTVVAEDDYVAGFPITAAALSRTACPEVADVAGLAFTRWQMTLSETMHRHGVEEPVAAALSNTLIAAVEGAAIMAIAQKSLTALDDIEAQLAILVQHHIASPR